MSKCSPHPFSPEIETEVFKEQNGKCINCGCPIDLRIDRPDHIVSQSKTMRRVYGDDLIYSKENCQIPCWHCHQNKGTWSVQKRKDLIKEWEPFSKSKIKQTQKA